jgi:hypothetical protein
MDSSIGKLTLHWFSMRDRCGLPALAGMRGRSVNRRLCHDQIMHVEKATSVDITEFSELLSVLFSQQEEFAPGPDAQANTQPAPG